MLARMWRKRNTPPLLVGLQAATTPPEISLVVPQKMDIVLPEDPAIPLLCIYPEDAQTCNKDTCSTIFKAPFYKSLELERTQMSLNRDMDTVNVVHLHN